LGRPVRDRASKVHIDAVMRILQALAEPVPDALVAIQRGKWVEERDAPYHRMRPQVKRRSFVNSLSWNLQTGGHFREGWERRKKLTLG